MDENNQTVKQIVEVGEVNEFGLIEIISGLTMDDYVVYPDPSIKEGSEVQMFDDFIELSYYRGNVATALCLIGVNERD